MYCEIAETRNHTSGGAVAKVRRMAGPSVTASILVGAAAGDHMPLRDLRPAKPPG